MNNIKDLYEYAKKQNFNSESYTRLAEYVKKSISDEFGKFITNGEKMDIMVNNVNIIYPGTPIEGSTAFGYIFESYAKKKILEVSNLFSDPDASVTNSSYDFAYINDYMKIMINFKVEKNGCNNNGVASINKFIKDYCSDSSPKLFFIFKVNYDILPEEGKIKITDTSCYTVESNISKETKQDSRNWKVDFKSVINGRFKIDNQNDIIPDIGVIKSTISNWINEKGIKVFEEQLGNSNGENDKVLNSKISNFKELLDTFNSGSI